MRTLTFAVYALLSSVAAALLAGCGGSPLPIGTAGAMLQAPIAGAHVEHEGSWMLPEARNQSLLYVSSYDAYVNVYSYPKGKLVGSLSGFGLLAEDCSDKLGDVWIIDNQNGVLYEYAHGGTTPVATLRPTSSDPFSCAVNPRNGDLAVGTGTEALLVYRHAEGTPTEYQDYSIEGYMYLAYDSRGDLFISGLTPNYKFTFAELAKRAASISNVALDQSIEGPGGVVAMAGEVAVGDADTDTVYEFQISGSGGTKIGTTQLDEAYDGLGAFLVRGKRIFALTGSQANLALDVFPWPGGGAPVRSITKDMVEPLGVALSVAPRVQQSRRR